MPTHAHLLLAAPLTRLDRSGHPSSIIHHPSWPSTYHVLDFRHPHLAHSLLSSLPSSVSILAPSGITLASLSSPLIYSIPCKHSPCNLAFPPIQPTFARVLPSFIPPPTLSASADWPTFLQLLQARRLDSRASSRASFRQILRDPPDVAVEFALALRCQASLPKAYFGTRAKIAPLFLVPTRSRRLSNSSTGLASCQSGFGGATWIASRKATQLLGCAKTHHALNGRLHQVTSTPARLTAC